MRGGFRAVRGLAQLLPLGLGAALRAFRPKVAARIEAPLARTANVLLVALVAGAACTGRDAEVRPAGAVAAAMRNPGLALVIATVNKVSATVTASIFGCALGAVLVVTAYVVWQSRYRSTEK